MIGRLHGILLEKYPPQLLLDVGGVGYEVEASMHTFYRLPENQQTVTLYTHFVVREDAQLLYGFYEQRERTLFRSLIKVNGVGPKLALGILSSMDPDEFVRCISDNDANKLVRIPGVGKKTAERLIIEMRDRLKDWTLNGEGESGSFSVMDKISNSHVEQEAISALVSLGYKPQEASRLVAQIEMKDLTSEQLIRQALKAVLR